MQKSISRNELNHSSAGPANRQIPGNQTDGSKAASQLREKKRATSGKESFTFKTKEQADEVVIPTVLKVDLMRKRDRTKTVKGWKQRLYMWLSRMERGSFSENRTPLFNSLSYSQIADKLTDLVKSNRARCEKLFSKVPRFYTDQLEKVEEHQAEKIGPKGDFPPFSEWGQEKCEDIFKDYPAPKSIKWYAWKQACRDTGDAYIKAAKGHKNYVTLRDFEECFKDAGTEKETDKSLNTRTNSCYPTYVRKWYHSIITAAVTLAQRATQFLLYHQARSFFIWALKQNSWRTIADKLHFVVTANQRTNVSAGHDPKGENVYKGHLMSKLRVTCAVEKLDTLLGKPILNILIDVAKDIRNPDGTRPFMALTTPEQIDKNMQVILDKSVDVGIPVLSTDFSGFDEHVAPWMAWSVACEVARFMEKHTANLYLALVYAETYQCRCITTSGIIPEGPSRRKSGTIFTNNSDSNENFTIQRYLLHAGYIKEIYAQVVNGDDACLLALWQTYFVKKHGSIPKVFEQGVSEVGMVGNAEKQYFDAHSLSFCQLVHVHHYPGGIYPISRAANACLSLEDDVKIETDNAGEFPYVLSYRTVCRLNTACFNPNFVQLINMFKQEDKIHLGANMPAARLASLAGSYATSYAREAMDKPWKAFGNQGGFAGCPANRVLRGELPPPPGVGLWEWVRGVSWDKQEL